MSDSVPREGDKNYKKKRTLKLDGFDDYDGEYYDAMTDRLDYLGLGLKCFDEFLQLF